MQPHQRGSRVVCSCSERRPFHDKSDPFYTMDHAEMAERRKGGVMPKSIAEERAQIEADRKRLKEREDRLAERQEKAALECVRKAGLLKVEVERLTPLLQRIKTLGVDEVERRLAA